MNYKKIYDQLVQKRRQFPLSKKDGYCEEHHVVPLCIGGQDVISNLVNLTPREHYIAHVLLAKIYGTLGLHSAVIYMKCASSSHNNNRDFKFNSRLYENLRKKFAKMMSSKMKGRYVGTHLSEEHKRKIGLSNKGKHKNHSKEFLDNLSNRMKGNQIWVGRHHTQATKDKISASERGKTLSAAHKQRNREAMLGCVFWNNGKINVRSKTCPPGFQRGRICRKSS